MKPIDRTEVVTLTAKNPLRRGFTLVELLVVIAIIALLAGILLPAMKGALLKAEKTQAQTEISAIKTSVQNHYNEYSKLPVPTGDQGVSDKTYDDNNAKTIIKALQGLDNTINPRKMIFLEAKDGATDGTFKDPWDKMYRIVFDNDYSGQIQYNTESIRSLVVVVSAGPDGTFGTTDDLYSHKI